MSRISRISRISHGFHGFHADITDFTDSTPGLQERATPRHTIAAQDSRNHLNILLTITI